MPRRMRFGAHRPLDRVDRAACPPGKCGAVSERALSPIYDGTGAVAFKTSRRVPLKGFHIAVIRIYNQPLFGNPAEPGALPRGAGALFFAGGGSVGPFLRLKTVSAIDSGESLSPLNRRKAIETFGMPDVAFIPADVLIIFRPGKPLDIGEAPGRGIRSLRKATEQEERSEPGEVKADRMKTESAPQSVPEARGSLRKRFGQSCNPGSVRAGRH
jgi:hypothetical protein